MTSVLAAIGPTALWLTYAWLLSAIVSAWLSDRKGYGEKPGLAAGLLLSVAGLVIWLLMPARQDSRWKVQGAIPRRGQQKTVAEARAEREEAEGGSDG